MKIKTLILIFILATTIVIFGVTIGYVSIYTKNAALNHARKIADSYSREYANLVEANLNKDVGVCRSLAGSETGFESFPIKERLKLFDENLLNTYKKNSEYLTMSAMWELGYLDPMYKKSYGRIRTEIHVDNGNYILKHDSLNLDGDNGLYGMVKTRNTEFVTDPYLYSPDKTKFEEVLITSISVPIRKDGEFVGLVVADTQLSSFQDSLSKIRPFEKSFAVLLANNGSFITSQNPLNIGKKVDEIWPEYCTRNSIVRNIKKGINFSNIAEHLKGNAEEKYYASYSPIRIGQNTEPWSIAIFVPYSVIVDEANHIFRATIIIGIIGLLILSILILYVTQKISSSLKEVAETLRNLARGNIKHTEKLTIKNQKNEIGVIKKSVNTLLDGLNSMADFANEIGKEKFDAKYKLLSSEDTLGQALVKMSKNLQKAQFEEDKRHEEDAKMNWATQGYAEIGEILRRNRENMEEFSFIIIQYLVKYIKANQGALFVINDEDPKDRFIQQMATYAYDRKHMVKKRYGLTEGFLGRCIQEQLTINLKEVPDDYILITSGLGDIPPKNLLLVPMIFDGSIFGVIELASLQEIDAFQENFIEKVAESVASAISNVKNSLVTSKLLEESRKSSDDLLAREVELRHRMSELMQLHEQTMVNEIEMRGILDAITSTSSIVHFDPYGKILKVNDSFFIDARYYTRDMVGRYHRDYAIESIEDLDAYEQFWQNLREGQGQKRVFNIANDYGDRWIFETYTPIFDNENKIYKVIAIQSNITEDKKRELELETQRNELLNQEEELIQNLEELQASQDEIVKKNQVIDSLTKAIDRAMMRAVYSSQGEVIEFNENYAKLLGYRCEEVVGMHMNTFLHPDDLEKTHHIWKEYLFEGHIYKSQVRRVAKNGEVFWFFFTYTPELDDNNQLKQVFYLGYNITDTKELASVISKRNDELQIENEHLNASFDHLSREYNKLMDQYNSLAENLGL